jgi:hypothetical protein
VYYQQVNRFETMTRAGLIFMIHNKTMMLKANDLKDAKAVTLMGTDMDRILNAINNLHETWAAIIQAGMAIWLLERQVHVACMVPTFISLCRSIAQEMHIYLFHLHYPIPPFATNLS